VVTEFEFTLHPVGTAALLVDLFYAPQDAAAAVRRWRGLLAAAPREATLTAWVGTTGQTSVLPSALWNRPLVSIGYVRGPSPTGGGTCCPRCGTRRRRWQSGCSSCPTWSCRPWTTRRTATDCYGATGRATSCASWATARSRPSWAAVTTAR
jgi:hypothetical protein